ncbi:MAG TPA: hypothetical protein VEK37_14305 [Gemmatimonadaceae bacterium]|nr:hypothetical protein [Gemmatimonadaceae bacterium]
MTSGPPRVEERAAPTLLRRIGFRGWLTAAKLAVICGIELVILFGYLDRQAIDHYALHPMIALASALPLLVALRSFGIAVREELLISYLFLNYARVPDYLFEAGIEHHEWMNVFLFHVAFDEIIGWALIFLTLQTLVLGVAYVVMKLRYSGEQAL